MDEQSAIAPDGFSWAPKYANAPGSMVLKDATGAVVYDPDEASFKGAWSDANRGADPNATGQSASSPYGDWDGKSVVYKQTGPGQQEYETEKMGDIIGWSPDGSIMTTKTHPQLSWLVNNKRGEDGGDDGGDGGDGGGE